MKFKYLFPILLFSPFLSLLFGCENDPLIVYEEVIIRDTIELTEIITDTTTLFILVRHAEKQAGNDPSLTFAGMERADELARVLDSVEIAGIYSTNTNRTLETAAPTADKQGLSTIIYDSEQMETLADSIIVNHKGSVALVVGHSNTTPELLNILTGTSDYTLSEDEYDNLFYVAVLEKGRAQVIHTKYGD